MTGSAIAADFASLLSADDGSKSFAEDSLKKEMGSRVPFTFARTGRKAMIAYSTVEGECPCCYGDAHRVRRRLVDRVVSLILPRHRYRCGSIGCGWEGNLPLRTSSLPSRTQSGSSATLGDSVKFSG